MRSLRKKRGGRTHSIITKMAVLFQVILIGTVLFVALFISMRFTHVLMQKEIVIGNHMTESLANFMQEKYNRVYSLSNYIHNSDLDGILATIKETPEEFYNLDYIQQSQVFFQGVYTADSDFSDLILVTGADQVYSFTSAGNYMVSTGYSFLKDPDICAFLENETNMAIFYDDPSEYCLNQRSPVITFMTKIYDASLFPGKKTVGVYLMNVPLAVIDDLLENEDSEAGAQIRMTARDGSVLYDSQHKQDGKMTELVNENEDSYTTVSQIGTTGMEIRCELPRAFLFREMANLRTPIIMIVVVSLLLTLLFVSMIGHMYRKRTRNLMAYMQEVQGGHFDARIEDEKEDEIGILSRSFNEMCERIDTYIDQVYKAEVESKNAQINALQTQINPHFLYNTLESIKAQAIKEGDSATPEMIVLLGKMFRWITRTDQHFVTIEEELEYIDTYLKLQSYRYDEPLDIDIQVDEQYLDYGIPKLTLQPIVENVIKHGLVSIDRRGLAGITVKKKGENLEISVYDNGKGMDEDRLEEIRERLKQVTKQEDFSSIGIQNVRSRIGLLFGPQYGIQVASILDMGTVVKVIIPAMTCEEMRENVQTASG